MDHKLEKYLAHAKDSLNDAQALYDRGGYGGSISRSYYSMFYCVQGMLVVHGTFPKSHKGISAKFSEYFIKSGLIDKRYGAAFKITFNNRQFADYDIDSEVTEEDALESLNNAKEFIEMAENYFKNQV